MSEEQMEEQTMSTEDKFFGVKTTIGGEQSDVDVEVVDDRPPEDRRPPAKEAKEEEGGDEELEGYSDKVKKRINKLRYQQHEERRQREAAEKMREEAVRVAQKYADENKKYHAIIQEGEQYLVHQIRERANLALEQAKSHYRQAYEEGNTDKVVEAQEAMIKAQSEFQSADYQMNQMNAEQQRRAQQPQQQYQPYPEPQPQPQPQPQVQAPPQPTEKAAKWAQDNPWFGQEKDMTALAYGIHERLVRDEGYDPNSDEYFETIDRTMRSKFPEYFGDEEVSTEEPAAKSPPVVTAPSSRNNGAKPRKVKLTRTQLSLAKRLGLTPEQYANQLVKEAQ
tara:strand:- start:311 stop:1318 length:1008 start_codon:yes stop_codon:yes gene_type:complete